MQHLTDEDLRIAIEVCLRAKSASMLNFSDEDRDYRAMQLRMASPGGMNEEPSELVELETAEGMTFREWCDGSVQS